MKLAATTVPVSTVWTSPDAPRDIDAPAIAEHPDVAAWAKSMDTETRLGLHGRTLTQLLFAEPVLVRSEHDGWSEILAPWQPSSQDELGYPGWVPSSHLGELPTSASDPVAIAVPTAELLVEPGGQPLTELSFATVLASVEHADGHTRVATPGGGSGWLQDAVLRSVSEPSDTDERLRLGEQFLGLEYLWGGTSAYGLDCSGLVHTVSRVLGIRTPRDAHDQAADLPNVPLGEVRPGDLYFFARDDKPIHHVGFVSPTGMLHASETGKRLENAPLTPDRRTTLVTAARF
ncbi:cell wall-associated NlpC family hydrolase [Kribbella aluminosa]|uniref:Cell wall-associated NlpC family hydrolase n=1 Tax=Kribbella aluminosa TaxID=416017 RepID=A0ABS4V070_9ACTN|nr:NlpC/P60 family protein [Kribbella aluminosa]MBP2357295.1 cell wall-associated NlpC family hydrolase [Kribbella aluminosa]